ncbi:hypothetical protein SAMN05720472_0912 [Fibrobacter sp. UWR3]|uniref:hypothetical protein n=1 Tax=Fibrobacter sp. UWR3 TaxID=1896217 RepID=UPI00091DC612|nr:hypothetical protein [Fibrobacter sp. UWR3]SHM25540.1 hypothetical protein SAMN05720472_0912 [Fibrobacter sp. UWR3]
MAGKSTLFKTAVALAFSILIATPWAAGLSDEQEGASKFYCVKLTRDVNYNAAIQLSQQNASYEPDSGESCFEKWDSPEGYQTAYEFIGELLYNSNVQPEALLLASDIDFGGYDGQTRSCNEYFKPFEFDITSQIKLTSAEDGIYTIRGICYTSLSDEASFGGNLIGSIQNVRFENIRLESLTFASLFGTAVNEPEVNNVYVANAAISAPVAGLFVSSSVGLYVTDFEGSSIQVRSVPDMDLNDAVDLIYPSSVAIGGLAGSVSNMFAVGVSVDGLSVSNNAYLWDGAHHFVEEVAMVEAHIGGIVGHTGRVELRRVGLDRSLLSDDASAGKKQMSYLGGLVGSLTYNTMVWFHSTYTSSDITCSLERGPQHCKAGYLAGLAVFSDSLSKNANDISIVSNFHYTEAVNDSASGMFGEAYCDYLKPYMPDNEQGLEHISCAYEFNTFGELSVLDDENGETTFAPKAYAHGNYRSAAGNAVATDNFNSDTYMLGGDAREAVSVGIIEKEYMQGQAFADVLNRFNADYGNTSVEWIADTSRVYPYVASTYYGVNAGVSNVHRIVFMLDCIESGCLTESEERMLGQFNNYRMGTNEFEFVTDESGAITNTAWLEFAASLEQPNADRDPVHWESSNDNGPYKKFSADEAYDGDYVFKLMPGEAQEETTEEFAYAFFGKGIDYDQTIIELISYDGETVENKGSQIDMMSYSGGSQPISLRAGKVMQIFSRNPVTTDGSDFKGWKVRAEMTFTTNETELKKIAFAGMDIPVDGDGYFSLGENWESLNARFEKALGENANALTESRSIALAIFPAGFEDVNGVDDDGEKQEEVEVVYPALFWSGNAIQLAVKTDDFVNEEGAPFVSVMLENLSDEPLLDTLMEFPNGGWPEVFTWEKYPLAAGMYHVVAKIYNGKGDNPDVREWTFEVKDVIENDCGDCWQMVALSNVDFEKYEWNDNEVFYWWDEFAIYGKYWQYKEFTKKDSPEHVRGYWYHSLEGRPLVLKDEAFTGEAVWHLDSVNTGWNMVANPYGWKMKIGVAGQENREEKPELEFWRWNKQTGQYDPPEAVEELEPYEAVWVKLNRGPEMDWSLPATPAFVDFVNEDGEIVHVKSLNKKGVLAKAAGADGWALQVELSDANGKMDSWNMLGAGKAAWDSEEPPAGMGNRVNLSIVDAGRRLAKSVKALGEDAYEWNVELSATSARAGYLKFAGIDGILASGLRVFVTVDGVTTEMHDGEKLQVMLSTTAKSANIRVAKSARKVVASTLQGLRAHDLGSALQVGFDVGEGLAGANARVDLVDTKGHVVNTASFKAENGRNEVSLERPVLGLYVLRAVVGREIAVQKIMVK